MRFDGALRRQGWVSRLGARLRGVLGDPVARSAMREPLFLEMLAYGLGKEPVTMIDVGSDDGVEAIHALRLGVPGLKVHLLEPDNGNLERCRKNVSRAIGRDAPVTFSNCAVSNLDRDGVFYRNAEASHLNSATPTAGANIKVPVRYVTLASYLQAQNIQGRLLIKMDIEGHEVEVLEHFADHVAAFERVAVLMEVHPSTYSDDRCFERVLRRYLAAGFRPELVESAGVAQPQAFRERGLEPVLISGRRGLYRDLADEFFLAAACHEHEGLADGVGGRPSRKLIRSVLLCKR